MHLKEYQPLNVSENKRLYPMFSPSLPICKNLNFLNQPYICQLVNRFKNNPRISSNPSNRLARSYYGSFGHGTLSAPTYYPTFDPISVLASLAFLAFLLQSFASLFDRSRSIIPTVVSSSKHLSSEIDEGIEERVMRALNEYAASENNFSNKNKEATTTKMEFFTK